MAYNTRRSGEAPNQVGQRRNNPPIGNNFVSGGQLAGPNRPFQQQQPQQGGNFRQMAPQQQQQQQPVPPRPVPNPQNQMQLKPNANVPLKQEAPANPPKQDVPMQQIPPAKIESFQFEGSATEGNADVEKKKPFWMDKGVGKGANKISRKERQRRRNVRLSRILQPKNAVMILNELVPDIAYNISDGPAPGGSQYLATINFDGINHSGYGHNKMEAKNNAAEQALKYVVKNKKFTMENKDDPDGDTKMDDGENESDPLPWQHVASFALFKLLNSWGEDPFKKTGSIQQDTANVQNKPSKKIPDNATHINPIMLLNQVMPHVQFEEVGQSGQPPHVNFNYSCTVDGQIFSGSGSNKKAAKKMVAFAVCSRVLGLQYPPEIYTPL